MTKNHLYHTLSPILLLASVVLLILTYLSPVLIFSDSVSLLHATIPTSSSSSSSSNSSVARREWRSVDELDAQTATRRMSKKLRRAHLHAEVAERVLVARASNKTTASKATTASSSTVTVYFGPMGACHKSSTNSTLTCSSPSFTPMFDELLDSLSASSSSASKLAATLPSQFPLAPAGLFLSFLALVAGFFVSLAHTAAHHVARLGRLQERASRMRRVMVGTLGAGWVLGVVVTLCFFVQLRHDTKKFGEVGVGGASAGLGRGFQMLVATWILSLLSLLLLGAETFTNRAR